MTSFTKRPIDVDGMRLNIHSGGGGTGPVFILVHGIGASHRYFMPLARLLAQHGTVHVLDMPGFGSTPKPDSALDIADFAAVALRALEDHLPGPAIIVGHSMGAQVAVEMGRRKPELAAAMILLAPAAEDGARTFGRQAARLMRNSARASLKSQLVVFFDYLRCGPVWFYKTMPAMLAYETEKHIAALQMPLLLVAGKKDPVAPLRWLQKLAASCHDARIERVPGPHALMYTDPPSVARLCLQMQQPATATPQFPTIDPALPARS